MSDSNQCPQCGGTKHRTASLCWACRYRFHERMALLLVADFSNPDICGMCGDDAYIRGLCSADYQWAHKLDVLDLAAPPKKLFRTDYSAEGRECSKCGEFKSWTNFPPQLRGKNMGHYSQCYECKRDASRAKHFERKYGITQGDFDRMLQDQGGYCANLECGNDGLTPDTGQVIDGVERLYPHHDHLTGEVLGLLCHACNSSSGLLRESPRVIRGLADFVESRSQLRLVNE